MSAPLLRVVTAEQMPARRRSGIDPRTLGEARAIVADVAERGEAAARAHAERLGDLRPGAKMVYGPDAFEAALERLPSEQRAVLERAAQRIGAFAEAQRTCLTDLAFPIPGGQAGHRCLPVESAGCYAPGGRFPLPSSVLMTVITARAAGVERVWVASPRPTDVTLAAASIAGADGLLAIGGAQAIAALSYGIDAMQGVDLIVGPGNRWVTAAKQIVSVEVGIDMLAGPSELVVLADESGDAAVVAADLLAQAEHDPDAVPILVTTSRELIGGVREALAEQLGSLPTAAIAKAALGNGFAVLVGSLEEGVAVCDAMAPEHLQVMMRDAEAVASRLKHCGGLFIGAGAAEVFGDYGAGPNHVLPTGGTARFRAGLSVFTFLRARTWMRIDDARESEELRHDTAALARMEGLEAHARAAEARERIVR